MSLIAKILFVDDDTDFLAALQRTYRKQFSLEVASSGAEALVQIEKNGPFSVVVADLGMAGMSGLEFLSRVSELAPETIQVVLTGDTEFSTFVESVGKADIFRYVAKSPDGNALRSVLIEALQEYAKRTTREP